MGRPKRKPGAPTKFTPKRRARIIKALADGNSYRLAAKVSGITQETLRDWRNRGETGEPGDEAYSAFSAAIAQARAAGEEKAVAVVMDVMDQKKDIRERAKMATWYLTHAHPKDWAETRKHEHTGKDGAPLVDMATVGARLAKLEEE